MEKILRSVEPDSCFQQLMEKKRNRLPKPQLPPSLDNLSSDTKYKEMATGEVVEALTQLKYSESERRAIGEATKQQAASTEWKKYRKGMITASQIRQVCTRMESYEKNPNISTDARVKVIMGYSAVPEVKAIKYGRAQEIHAKKLYGKLQSKFHKQFSQTDSGLVVSKECVFIGSSPDLLVTCTCHGPGLCEIKCPYKIKHEKPTSSNLQYLVTNANNNDTLKVNHDYYFQIQTQMATCGLNYCDFFVYTNLGKDGYHLERINFDCEFWASILTKARSFWKRFVGPELVTHKLENSAKEAVVQQSCTTEDHTDHPYFAPKIPPPRVKACYKPVETESLPVTVFLCGICCKDACDDVVECENCKLWFHFTCVCINVGEEPSETDTWICKKCLAEFC